MYMNIYEKIGKSRRDLSKVQSYRIPFSLRVLSSFWTRSAREFIARGGVKLDGIQAGASDVTLRERETTVSFVFRFLDLLSALGPKQKRTTNTRSEVRYFSPTKARCRLCAKTTTLPTLTEITTAPAFDVQKRHLWQLEDGEGAAIWYICGDILLPSVYHSVPQYISTFYVSKLDKMVLIT